MLPPSLAPFRSALIVTLAGLGLGAALGYAYEGSAAGALRSLFVVAVLAVLEISLSFDNAIVNATRLRAMRPEWQRRFLTWGILIAVFGMRLVFPLAVVVVAAGVGPWQALHLAATDPDAYARILDGAHLAISAFGGAFLMMVGLRYFCDGAKEVHWFGWLERRLARAARMRGLEIGLVIAAALAAASFLGPGRSSEFLTAALWGVLTFLAVDALGLVLDGGAAGAGGVAQGGLGAFLYLEMLDASFSFDGVIGAFALSRNIFVIAIGLGVGAMYVRSLTVVLVRQGALARYRFLEHGAFYAILVLAGVMFAQSVTHVPETVTGLAGAGLIGAAVLSSLSWRRRHP